MSARLCSTETRTVVEGLGESGRPRRHCHRRPLAALSPLRQFRTTFTVTLLPVDTVADELPEDDQDVVVTEYDPTGTQSELKYPLASVVVVTEVATAPPLLA